MTFQLGFNYSQRLECDTHLEWGWELALSPGLGPWGIRPWKIDQSRFFTLGSSRASLPRLNRPSVYVFLLLFLRQPRPLKMPYVPLQLIGILAVWFFSGQYACMLCTHCNEFSSSCAGLVEADLRLSLLIMKWEDTGAAARYSSYHTLIKTQLDSQAQTMHVVTIGWTDQWVINTSGQLSLIADLLLLISSWCSPCTWRHFHLECYGDFMIHVLWISTVIII